ncbi:nucleoside deaminase [uncultured Chitinophaga sp.]|jgi:Cytosine/adenosine deaminases|uniref:nucleoside deaminase n=1 Tax=uncultured Chitinophaga sp. TaxID=339340 RepID=UPI002626A52D|nr:nucleoside deaminase [uncultured Chitinophaga sp.]
MQDQQYMDRCLELAAMAAAAGESAVGCVIVKDGQIIGEAYEKSRQLKDITRHAEALAVIDAVQKTGSCAGATLYTNVEPCLLCSYVIRHHRIARVVYGKACGELGGTHPPFNLLTTDDITAWGSAPLVTVYPGE